MPKQGLKFIFIEKSVHLQSEKKISGGFKQFINQ